AAGVAERSQGMLEEATVAAGDYRNVYEVVDGGGPLPAGVAAVPLFASAGGESYGAVAAVLRHSGQLDADDFYVGPSRAEFHGERNRHRRADGREDLSYGG